MPLKVLVGLLHPVLPIMLVVGAIKEEQNQLYKLEKPVLFSLMLAEIVESPSPLITPDGKPAHPNPQQLHPIAPNVPLNQLNPNKLAIVGVPMIFRAKEVTYHKDDLLEIAIYEIDEGGNVKSSWKTDIPNHIAPHFDEIVERYPMLYQDYENVLQQTQKYYEQLKRQLKSNLIIANNLPQVSLKDDQEISLA